MGMDVYGKNKSHPTGKYFRNNCWWWRPLWDYCAEVAPELITPELHKSGHFNDGAGLKTARDCKALAAKLREEISSGRTGEYAIRYAAAAKSGPKVGSPEDSLVSALACKVDGDGQMYPFDASNVAEFADFLEHCGGFRIH